jgi:hypothetical protein
MANATAVVDMVRSLSSSLADVRDARRVVSAERFVTVELQSGVSGRLDMAQPRSVAWAEVLHSLREARQPAYLEIEPATRVITELLCPVTVQVGAIREAESRAEVELIISHARHYLLRARPDFRELLDALKRAHRSKSSVLVTETDAHQIIDVRPAGKSGGGQLQGALVS